MKVTEYDSESFYVQERCFGIWWPFFTNMESMDGFFIIFTKLLDKGRGSVYSSYEQASNAIKEYIDAGLESIENKKRLKEEKKKKKKKCHIEYFPYEKEENGKYH